SSTPGDRRSDRSPPRAWFRGSGTFDGCSKTLSPTHHWPPFYISFRYSCTNWTAIAPSPTAEATRLTEPDRTSPEAKTPGRLVSRRYGWRAAVHCEEPERAGPVRTNSLASLSISGGSHRV